jgi:hypothetical protein
VYTFCFVRRILRDSTLNQLELFDRGDKGWEVFRHRIQQNISDLVSLLTTLRQRIQQNIYFFTGHTNTVKNPPVGAGPKKG